MEVIAYTERGPQFQNPLKAKWARKINEPNTILVSGRFSVFLKSSTRGSQNTLGELEEETSRESGETGNFLFSAPVLLAARLSIAC